MTPHHEMTVLDAIYGRRATRAYTDAMVPEGSVRELLRAAVHAPTAMHREPWCFAVIQDRPLLAKICARAKTAVSTPNGAAHRELAHGLPPPFGDPKFDIFYGASTLIVVCTRLADTFGVADCWLAAENLMLAATGLGLATCPIGFAMPALANPELQHEVGIPTGVTPVAAIIVGTPAGAAATTSRRDPEILSWKR
jgi:nitroreductase